jgi:hypothetical protein
VELVKELPMADEHAHAPVGTVANGPTRAGDSPLEHATHNSPHAADDGGAKEMLKGAITKVMEEISHHEKEARRHVKQAESLKRDLRDSFAFLQEKRAAKHRPEAPPDAAVSANEQTEAKPTDAATPNSGRSTRRKRRGRKGKKA